MSAARPRRPPRVGRAARGGRRRARRAARRRRRPAGPRSRTSSSGASSRWARSQWVVKNVDATQVLQLRRGRRGALIQLFDGTRTLAEIHDDLPGAVPGRGRSSRRSSPSTRRCCARWSCSSSPSAERNLRSCSRIKDARRRDGRAEGGGLRHLPDPLPRLRPRRVPEPDRRSTCAGSGGLPPSSIVARLHRLMTVGVIVAHFGPIWSRDARALRVPAQALLGRRPVLRHPARASASSTSSPTATSCKIYGGEVHDIGVALLYFMPAFYCDTTDALLFPSKWHRLWVALAGMYIEAIICCVATALWVASYPDTLLHELAYKTMLFTGVSTHLLQHQPAEQDRRLLRAVERPRDPGAARGLVRATSARSSSATSCG